MKKTNIILVMMFLVGVWATSCIKEKETVNKLQKETFTATAVKMNGNQLKTVSDYSGNYALSAKVGHNSSDCGGGCVMMGGVRKHVACQGAGNICELKASIMVSKENAEDPNNQNYNGIGLNDYEPTDETFYNMPARSFYIEDKEFENEYIWLNIPAQMLERDAKSNLFRFYKITFTTEPLFENL